MGAYVTKRDRQWYESDLHRNNMGYRSFIGVGSLVPYTPTLAVRCLHSITNMEIADIPDVPSTLSCKPGTTKAGDEMDKVVEHVRL